MDEARYIALSKEHMGSFFRVAYSIVGNRADAEDAVQQTLLQAWQHRSRAHPGAERAWMMRILVNECYTCLRRRKKSVPMEELPPPQHPPESDHSALHEAIRTLPENLRTPLLLKYMESMSEKEVAAAMGLPVSSVKNRLFRARKKLQQQLNEEVGL